MITIILILLALNYLFAKLMIYGVLEVFKLVTNNQHIFLQVASKNMVDLAIYYNHRNDIIKKSSFPHIPILNVFTSIACLIFIQFFKNKLK